MAIQPTPFHLHIPDSAIEDLRARFSDEPETLARDVLEVFNELK